MSAAAAVSRRGFIIGATAVGGALIIGVSLQRLRRGGAQQSQAGTLNAYVRVGPDGHVTLVMPKVEMGQGTYTSLPMLIAEELEVDLAATSIEAAPPDAAVYGFNGELHGGDDWDQSTGGSTSVRDCWLRLRTVGATARSMLISAAAQRWHVPQGECVAAHGEVLHSPSGRRLGYGVLAAAAALIKVPAAPALKNPKDYRLIGHPTPRRDTPAKVNGSAIFGIDARPPQAQVAIIAFAPVAGGSIAQLSQDAALAVKGVTQVVSDTDLIAVVAADTWAAMKGMKALAPRWNDGANSAVQQSALVAELEAAVREPGAVAAKAGNVTPPTHGATLVEALYHQPFLAHATLEPMNCTVHWQDGLCEFWTGTQAPDRAVAKLADLGLKPEQIRIHNLLIGGGFGRRLEVDGLVLGARVARHVKGPVRVLWDRAQDIQHDLYRPYYVDHLSASLDKRGNLLSWRHTIAGAAVSAIYSGEPLKNGIDDDAVEASANPAYAFANMEVRYVRHDPQGVATSWWRGVGPTRSVFVVESFMDELAAAGRQDPVQFRRGLLKDERMRAVLDLAADRAGWGKALPPGSGRGVSIQHAFGSYLAQVVEVSMGEKGQVRVERVVCVLDCGQIVNPDTVRAQLEGGATFGISAALANEITIANGRVQQSNFHDFPSLRITEAPRIEVHLVENHETPGGVGETGTACVAAALCNAIYAATGKRVRTLPVSRGLHA